MSSPCERTHETRTPRLAQVVAVVATCVFAVSCSGSPAGPTTSAPTMGSGATVPSQAEQAAGLTPQDLVARGWECRPSPVPGRIACSHPNQGFPPVPPTPDRPPTFTLLVWDGTNFGTLLLIRSDLYRGQTCGSTGEPYIFRPVIGYFECLHTP